MSNSRPDPDQLLQALQQEEEAARRGKLKIFFGACAGVGKTYAMLSAARQQQKQGVAVLVGVVETHGRAETAALLDGLPMLPSRSVDYRGRLMAEFDLDAALASGAQLIVVDELPHSNLPGSRHQKRWQDIEELLANGIHVYSALNVQHLESLNDVVGSITGIRVRETVPDHVFDAADEVSLVDLPPDELLLRLAQGKVYLADAAERATQHFFRKGNLIALRELALRRTADRVDAQMRAYRQDRAIENVWQAKERLMVCIGAGGSGEKLVRAAARLASKLQADWLAVHVETPALQGRSKAGRASVLATLRLAEELGAETATLAGSDAVATLRAYAQSRNVSKLVIGHRQRASWWRVLRPGLADRLAAQAAELDLYLVGMAPDASPSSEPASPIRLSAGWRGYAAALGSVALTTVLASLLLSVFDLANVVMVFLLAVVLVAIRFGRGPGALAACLAVASFDFFFVPPRLTFTVNDTQYLFTFALMLAVALIIGQLAARLRFEADMARQREYRADELAKLAQALSGALLTEQVVTLAGSRLPMLFGGPCVLLLPDSHEKLRPMLAPEAEPGLTVDSAVAQWVYDHQQAAGLGTQTLPASAAHYLPLKAPMRTRGVLMLAPADAQLFDEPEDKRLLDACAAQIALALERVHFVEVAQDALVQMEGERLRNDLLAAVSHDLRTPLTALQGLAQTLDQPGLDERQRLQLTAALREKTQATTELVIKLLEMARLQAGAVQLQRDWNSLEEVVGSALHQLDGVLASHPPQLALDEPLPLCEFDPVLIERVLVNLLDNAAKYSPPGSPIRIAAQVDGARLQVAVEDRGPGFPPGQEEKLFDKFARGDAESAQPGVGLGLAICRAIVEAHGGQLRAHNLAEGGARLVFTLPLGQPPHFAEPEHEH
jgi:two-component system sensor histidine kinase KdpD